MNLNTKLTLRVKDGPGFIIGVTELYPINGRVDFNGIQFTDEGTYTLEVVSDNSDIENKEFTLNVLPEEEFIPQEEIEEEEESEPLEGSRPMVSQILEPTVDLPPIKFPKSDNDNDNSEIINALGYIPFLWYNGTEIRGSDIISLKLYYEDSLPKCKATFIDTLGLINNDDTMPLNDTKFEIFLNSGSDILKSIHLRFKMQFNQESKNKKTQTITGVIDINDSFYKIAYNSYNGTSFDVFKKICNETGLGFNSNITNTNDKMIWRKNGLNFQDFMRHITHYSYISDNSFLSGYIDFYCSYNYIDMEKEWNRDISNDLALNTHGLSSIQDKTELVSLTLTNDPAQDSSGFFFNKYRFRNNSTYQTTNKGTFTISRTYDRNKKEFLKFDIDSLNSEQSDNVILKSKPNETSEMEDNYSASYSGKIDTDNIHANYLYAFDQNERNKRNLYNISVELNIPHPNFNLYRYQKIKVNFINLKQTPIDEKIVKERLTGEWMIVDIMFIFSRGSLKQKLVIVRKELSKTVKEKNNQEIEDTSDNNSEINENPTDNILNETEEIENEDFIFSGNEFNEGPEFTERDFRGEEESEQIIPPEDKTLYKKESEQINNTSAPITDGNWDIDLIHGFYVDNSGNNIELAQVEGSAINVKIVGKYLDMKEAASNDGVVLRLNSGFRSPYDNINTQSVSGVRVKATSQEELYNKWKAGVPGYNLAAKPGTSKHGNGISLDLNTGSKRKGNLNTQVYSWLIRNSWKYGFIRTVRSEEWHFDYLPNLIKSTQKGPYSRLAGNDSNLFFSDLGLDRLA